MSALPATPSAASGPEAAQRRSRLHRPRCVDVSAGVIGQLPARAQAATEAEALLGVLRRLAGQLQELEQTHARALQATMPEAAGLSASESSPTSGSLGRLEHALRDAVVQQQRCTTQRAATEDALDQLEAKRAKTQQRLDGLRTLRDTEAAAAPALRTGPSSSPPAAEPASHLPEARFESADTKAAKARLASLDRQITALDNQFRNVLAPCAKAAKQAAQAQLTAAEARLSERETHPALSRDMEAGRLELRRRFNLPDIFADSQARDAPLFEQFLDALTVADGSGTLLLHPDLRQGELCAMALSALCEAATCHVGTTNLLFRVLRPPEPQPGTLRRMVTGAPTETAAKLLEKAVAACLDRVMEIKLPRLIEDGENLPSGPATRDEKARRRNVRAAAEDAGKVLKLLKRYREEAATGLLVQASRVVSAIADDYREQIATAETLNDHYMARRQDMQQHLEQSQTIRSQREAEQTRLLGLQEADRAARAKRGAPLPAAAMARPTGTAVIPETTTATAGPDREVRIAQLQGKLAGLELQCATARSQHEAAIAADQAAARQQRRAREAYKAAVAAYGRAQDSARREREEMRTQRAAQREQLAALEHEVGRARDTLLQHPALTRLLEPSAALQRAIERHVEPDDAALRQRARRDTGYAGAYHSLGHLVEAVCDIYEDAARHSPGLFAARSRAEFDAAAAALAAEDGKGAEDRVCTHPRAEPIARGYSNDPDQTERPVPVRESCYSLCWHQGGGKSPGKSSVPQQGRVVISHLYPLVPHRRLQTLEP